MITTSTLLSRRVWRRLERNALRGHDRDLQRHLRELARARPSVLDTEASSTTGVVSLQLSGHRLVLGGVKPSTARDIMAMAHSPAPLELRDSGRYGPFWWIAMAGGADHMILATHVRLIHDRGRSRRTELDLPVLSGAP